MDRNIIVLYIHMKGMGIGDGERNLMDIIPRIYPSFCRPFGGQKPSSVVDHGIWFFIEPDPFSRNVIRNCMNVMNSRSWVTLKTIMLHQFPRRSLAGDTGLNKREQNNRTWNRDNWILCIHMLNTVIKKKTAFFIEFCFEGGYRSSNF
jgi:hypothetical protein